MNERERILMNKAQYWLNAEEYEKMKRYVKWNSGNWQNGRLLVAITYRGREVLRKLRQERRIEKLDLEAAEE